ncbi:hypothetical protein SLS62_009291 [Diatrype stigma]|uniref:Uncharacterized protein n=1 Tax=Diatrype stigma TaxID=117547 RepID=A0AAN9YLH0_9PEZI
MPSRRRTDLYSSRKNNTAPKIQQREAEFYCTGVRTRRLHRVEHFFELAFDAHVDLDAANDSDEELEDEERVEQSYRAFRNLDIFVSLGWRYMQDLRAEQASRREDIIAQIGVERYHQLDNTIARLQA